MRLSGRALGKLAMSETESKEGKDKGQQGKDGENERKHKRKG